MNNKKNWKEFCLDDLFEIGAGNYHSKDDYDQGETPYITASARNNGIAQRINLEPEFKANAITTGKVGCTAFYQSENFCASSDVNILRAIKFKMNYKIGVFITSIINFSENYKWAYGRQCRVGDSKKIKIKLPILIGSSGMSIIDSEIKLHKEGYVLDLEFMENFIENIESKENGNSIINSIKTNNLDNNVQLDKSKWKEFVISDIFEVEYGVNLELNKCEETTLDDVEAINFVSRSRENNGVTAYVKNIPEITPQSAGLITVAGGGSSVLSTFVQQKPFYSGRDLYLLIPREEMSIYTKQFICTIIMANKYKYSFGRQANKTLAQIKIMLPAISDTDLDYNYMDDLIKSLPFGDKL